LTPCIESSNCHDAGYHSQKGDESWADRYSVTAQKKNLLQQTIRLDMRWQRRQPSDPPVTNPILHQARELDCTLHGLRYAHATSLIAAGMPVKVISDRLGYANISTTMNIYGHVLPKMQREAADIVENIWTGDSAPDARGEDGDGAIKEPVCTCPVSTNAKRAPSQSLEPVLISKVGTPGRDRTCGL